MIVLHLNMHGRLAIGIITVVVMRVTIEMIKFGVTLILNLSLGLLLEAEGVGITWYYAPPCHDLMK